MASLGHKEWMNDYLQMEFSLILTVPASFFIYDINWIDNTDINYVGSNDICCYPEGWIISLFWSLERIFYHHMMMSSNGNIFCITGHLCREFTGHGWIPHTKAVELSLICNWINGWLHSGEAGDFEMPLHSLWHHCNDMTLSKPLTFLCSRIPLHSHLDTHLICIAASQGVIGALEDS